MSQTALRFSGRIPHWPIFTSPPPLIKALGLSIAVLVAVMATPSSSFAQSLYISPNPVYVGGTVTVWVTTTCNCENNGASPPSINGLSVTWTNSSTDTHGNPTFQGYATPGTPGTQNITGTSSCGDNLGPYSLTVVQLNDTTIIGGPTSSKWGSAWAATYTNTTRDCISLVSSTRGDAWTFGLDITPYTTNAATLISWNNATPLPGAHNLQATMSATTVVGPIPVNAIPPQNPPAAPAPAPAAPAPRNVWIMAATLMYNFTDNFDQDDQLTFGYPPSEYPCSRPRCAGPFEGNTIQEPGTTTFVACFTKMELTATFAPSGVGNLLNTPDGNGVLHLCSFQQVLYQNAWVVNGSPASTLDLNTVTSTTPCNPPPAGSPAGITNSYVEWDPPPPAQLIPGLNDQVSPVTRDKIFFIDDPGWQLPPTIAEGYIGYARNFADAAYLDGVQCSPTGKWHSLTKGVGPNLAAWIICSEGGGWITLPRTWGGNSGPGDGSWSQ